MYQHQFPDFDGYIVVILEICILYLGTPNTPRVPCQKLTFKWSKEVFVLILQLFYKLSFPYTSSIQWEDRDRKITMDSPT